MKLNTHRLIVLALLCASTLSLFAKDYIVTDYGAKGDGKNLDSKAINAAIDHCAQQGGGNVVVPAGTYLCGSIHLKSNIELHLTAGATITATDERGAYDPSETFGGPEYQDGGHTYFHNSLIWAEGSEQRVHHRTWND